MTLVNGLGANPNRTISTVCCGLKNMVEAHAAAAVQKSTNEKRHAQNLLRDRCRFQMYAIAQGK
jgi:hypothetical protein